MLVSFTDDEILKIGRGMSQRQEGLIAFYEYLERAYPAAAMNSVNTSGEQSEKFKGFALCLEKLFSELSSIQSRAEELARNRATKVKQKGHVLIV
jgi:hypothetical protein